MYTVLWSENGRDYWERCESRREVTDLLIKHGLEDDEDVTIFSPKADDHIVSRKDILTFAPGENMTKANVLKKIGAHFGHYEFRGGKHYIDNGHEVFEYASEEEALKDWLMTLVESDAATKTYAWTEEICFILRECNVKLKGVRVVEGVKGTRFEATIDYPSEKRHGKTSQKSGGTFGNPVDAYIRRQELLEERKAFFMQ